MFNERLTRVIAKVLILIPPAFMIICAIRMYHALTQVANAYAWFYMETEPINLVTNGRQENRSDSSTPMCQPISKHNPEER
jgi:hypothetical protein